MSALYESIKKLCDERGIKPGKMCAETGISRGMISDLKSGRTKSITSDTAQKIADYFNVSVDLVLGAEQKEKPAHNVDEPNLFDASDAELLAAFKNAPDYKKDAIRDLLGLK